MDHAKGNVLELQYATQRKSKKKKKRKHGSEDENEEDHVVGSTDSNRCLIRDKSNDFRRGSEGRRIGKERKQEHTEENEEIRSEKNNEVDNDFKLFLEATQSKVKKKRRKHGSEEEDDDNLVFSISSSDYSNKSTSDDLRKTECASEKNEKEKKTKKKKNHTEEIGSEMGYEGDDDLELQGVTQNSAKRKKKRRYRSDDEVEDRHLVHSTNSSDCPQKDDGDDLRRENEECLNEEPEVKKVKRKKKETKEIQEIESEMGHNEDGDNDLELLEVTRNNANNEKRRRKRRNKSEEDDDLECDLREESPTEKSEKHSRSL